MHSYLQKNPEISLGPLVIDPGSDGDFDVSIELVHLRCEPNSSLVIISESTVSQDHCEDERRGWV